ncbi:hypothetical protein [Actinokineospora sp.]|uniref:hypothetical protein n=1 Tax=Actinokineospora sp. TaxID=1872133 RepID=UPI003D6BF168
MSTDTDRDPEPLAVVIERVVDALTRAHAPTTDTEQPAMSTNENRRTDQAGDEK